MCWEGVGWGAHLPNLKQPRVELRSETVAAFAIGHERSAGIQITVDQQGSAGMNARVIQPLSWSEAAEATHHHRHGQVTGGSCARQGSSRLGAVGQGGFNIFLRLRH